MVLCESNRAQDEGNLLQSYKPKISQNKYFEERDGKDINEVKDLEQIALNEKSLQSFPIQEDGYIDWINIGTKISRNHCKEFGVLLLG